MKKDFSNSSLAIFENKLFEELSALESVLILTKESCYTQEIKTNYYDLDNENKLKLSDERNHYLNLLTIALDKIHSLKAINRNIEFELTNLEKDSNNSCRKITA